MNFRSKSVCSAALLGVALVVPGCSKKQSADLPAEATQLEKAFADKKAAVANKPAVTAPDSVDNRLSQTVSAMRAKDYEAAATNLTALQQQPNLNADQLMAVSQTMRTLQKDLAERAAKGDLKAKAAIERLNREAR